MRTTINRMMALIAACSITLTSCVPHKKLVNFSELQLPEGVAAQIDNKRALRIQPDDLLRIVVHSIDPLAAAPFNLESPTGGANQNQDAATLELFKGYLVDREGFIDFPMLGKIKAADLTLEDIKFRIQNDLKVFLKDPVVSARFLNFKATVLGEVRTPGVVRFSNSRVTLLEALGYAGDLSDYADRTDILLIRENGERREYKHFNLQTEDIFSSPYFYLEQNDVIYVKPIPARTATVADRGQRIVSYGTAFLSVVTLLIALSTRDSDD